MKVAAIILNWNRPQETVACCRALANQTHRPLQIWVVDNGSTVPAPAELKNELGAISLLRLEENRGFAGGVNAGLKSAREAGSFDFVWLVNNDVLCAPTVLGDLLQAIQADPRLAAVSSEMSEGGVPDRPQRRVFPGKKLRPPFYIPVTARSPAETDYLCGACLLIRREALNDVGGFDERYFFFFEDADWCFRARRRGWKLAGVSIPGIFHAGSATIGALSRLQAAYYRAGHVRFVRTYAAHPWLAAVPTTAWRLILDALRGRWPAVTGTWEGWKQGWQSTCSAH